MAIPLHACGQLHADQFSGRTVVKAFNTMDSGTLAREARPCQPRDERLALFVAGNDEGAKRIVSELIERIGFAAVDTGSLTHDGSRQQPGSPIYNHPMTANEAEQVLAMLANPTR